MKKNSMDHSNCRGYKRKAILTGFIGTKKDLEITNSVQSAATAKKMHSAAAQQVSLSYDYGAFNRRHIVIWTR